MLRHVRHVLFVLSADMLEHVGVRQQPFPKVNREGFGERLRISDLHRHVDVAEVAAREALLDAQVLAVAVPSGIESGSLKPSV